MSRADDKAFDGLTLLKRGETAYPETPDEASLETFPNRYADRDYWVQFDCPEFTARCPVTNQPDFGHIIIRYVPDRQCSSAELAPLFQLASALKDALTPVSASAFKEKLGYELVSYGPPVVVLGRSVSKRKARAWVAVAAAGSLLSAAGVTALVLRRMRSVKNVTSQPAAA